YAVTCSADYFYWTSFHPGRMKSLSSDNTSGPAFVCHDDGARHALRQARRFVIVGWEFKRARQERLARAFRQSDEGYYDRQVERNGRKGRIGQCWRWVWGGRWSLGRCFGACRIGDCDGTLGGCRYCCGGNRGRRVVSS